MNCDARTSRVRMRDDDREVAMEDLSARIRQWISSSLTEEEVDALAKLVPITGVERFLLTTPLWQSLALVALALALILAVIWWKVRTVDKRRQAVSHDAGRRR